MGVEQYDLTLLTLEQADSTKELEVLKKNGKKMLVTDFSILLGANVSKVNNLDSLSGARFLEALKDRTGPYITSSAINVLDGIIYLINLEGNQAVVKSSERSFCIRPAIKYDNLDNYSSNIFTSGNGVKEIEFGEYPQTAVTNSLNSELENLFNTNSLNSTGKSYTTDSSAWNDLEPNFIPLNHKEFEYNGKKYIRVISSDAIHGNKKIYLNNGFSLENLEAKPVWIEVEPIRWLVDEKSKTLVCKKGIASGIQFNDLGNDKEFEITNIKLFMDNHLSREILDANTLSKLNSNKSSIQPKVKKKNPYSFDFKKVTEEDIIRGMVEAGIAVFLHGKSSEGKSARVKQIDPGLEIVYLRNATPDSLNGKSVYNPETGQMIDIPPTWYKKLKEKCEAEPDKIHIAFFDEITNALPAIQGMAYNIVLDREVNGIWKLPPNARVVAAGNDYNDSIAANQLAEPLFNRFAHVYIYTSVEAWLKWAMTADIKRENLNYVDSKPERKIHPAVYAYIAFKGEEALRSPYTGEKPNADPRKWEMASVLLYKTGKPEMLRGLIGEELTADFIKFCDQKTISLEDVIYDRWQQEEINFSDISEVWATVVAMSAVDFDNVAKVREFVSNFDPEMLSTFDSLWSRGDRKRLDKLSELNLTPYKSSGSNKSSVPKRYLIQDEEIRDEGRKVR